MERIENRNRVDFSRERHRTFRSLSISAKIIIGFSLPVFLMAVVSTVDYFSTKSLVEIADWVQHTQKVIAKSHLLEKLVVDMETGERGFLITGKDVFLEPFIASEKQWELEI